MSTNRDFTEMSGRSNEVNRPVMPQEEEEREIVARERQEMIGEGFDDEASGDAGSQPDPYSGDPASEDHATELERESGEKR